MDYAKTKEEAQTRKKELSLRLLAIPGEKKKLDEEAENAKRELIGLDQILDGVEFMTSEIPPDLEPSGFTDKIRKILSDTQTPLLPTQIRDLLEASGTTGSSSRNLLISVHTVLERIKNELEESTNPSGKIAYKRKTPWTIAADNYFPKMRAFGALMPPDVPPYPPAGIAAVIQGGTATDAPENQPPQSQEWRKQRRRRMKMAAAAALEKLNSEVKEE